MTITLSAAMKNGFRRSLCLALVFCFMAEQSGFAQIVRPAAFPAYIRELLPLERFQPVRLSYVGLEASGKTLRLLLDAGSEPVDKGILREETSRLMRYFQTGLRLPDSAFWVNLRPDSPDEMIDPRLEQTDLGRVLLEADLQLKKDLARMTDPGCAQGKTYWQRLYTRAQELYGADEMEIPTCARPWIVPGEIILGETASGAQIYKAGLKIMLEQEYLQAADQGVFSDQRAQLLNEYSCRLIKELVIPQLTRQINSAKRYAALRQVYSALILARWYKNRLKEAQPFIDSGDLSGLRSERPWRRDTYFRSYQRSYQQGEYSREETIALAGELVVRQYRSGGAALQEIAVDSVPLAGPEEPAALDGAAVKAVYSLDRQTVDVQPQEPRQQDNTAAASDAQRPDMSRHGKAMLAVSSLLTAGLVTGFVPGQLLAGVFTDPFLQAVAVSLSMVLGFIAAISPVHTVVSAISLMVFESAPDRGGNTKNYADTPLPADTVEEWPSVTIQVPVYKEPFGVIRQTLESALEAKRSYEEQTGSPLNIVVNDDGLNIFAGNRLYAFYEQAKALPAGQRTREQEEVVQRLDFYRSHGIGFVARPMPVAGVAHTQRAGRFKKASNMNFGVRLHKQAQQSSLEETLSMPAYRYAAAEGDIAVNDYIILLDKDSYIPAGAIEQTIPEFIANPLLAYTQHRTEPTNADETHFAGVVAGFTNNLYAVTFKTRAMLGFNVPFVGHNAILRTRALEEAGWWDEDSVSEDLRFALTVQSKGYFGKYIDYPGMVFGEMVTRSFTEEAYKYMKFAFGSEEIWMNPLKDWLSRGPFSAQIRSYAGSDVSFWHKLDMGIYLASFLSVFLVVPGIVSMTYLMLTQGMSAVDIGMVYSPLLTYGLLVPFSNLVYDLRTNDASGGTLAAVSRLGKEWGLLTLFYAGSMFHQFWGMFNFIAGRNIDFGATSVDDLSGARLTEVLKGVVSNNKTSIVFGVSALALMVMLFADNSAVFPRVAPGMFLGIASIFSPFIFEPQLAARFSRAPSDLSTAKPGIAVDKADGLSPQELETLEHNYDQAVARGHYRADQKDAYLALYVFLHAAGLQDSTGRFFTALRTDKNVALFADAVRALEWARAGEPLSEEEVDCLFDLANARRFDACAAAIIKHAQDARILIDVFRRNGIDDSVQTAIWSAVAFAQEPSSVMRFFARSIAGTDGYETMRSADVLNTIARLVRAQQRIPDFLRDKGRSLSRMDKALDDVILDPSDRAFKDMVFSRVLETSGADLDAAAAILTGLLELKSALSRSDVSPESVTRIIASVVKNDDPRACLALIRSHQQEIEKLGVLIHGLETATGTWSQDYSGPLFSGWDHYDTTRLFTAFMKQGFAGMSEELTADLLDLYAQRIPYGLHSYVTNQLLSRDDPFGAVQTFLGLMKQDAVSRIITPVCFHDTMKEVDYSLIDGLVDGVLSPGLFEQAGGDPHAFIRLLLADEGARSSIKSWAFLSLIDHRDEWDAGDLANLVEVFRHLAGSDQRSEQSIDEVVEIIAELHTQGIAVPELERSFAAVSQGQMDFDDPLHLLANLLIVRQECAKLAASSNNVQRWVPQALHYSSFSRLTATPEFREEKPGEMPQDDLLDIRGLVYEAAEMLTHINVLRQNAARQNRKMIVIANLSYGGMALAPITEVRQEDGQYQEYIVGSDIPVWETKIGSTESHHDEFVWNDQLLSPAQIDFLADEQPLVVVVDGTTSVADADRTSAHVCDAYKGYRNFFMALNDALLGDSHPADFGLDDEFARGLLRSVRDNVQSAPEGVWSALQGLKGRTRSARGEPFALHFSYYREGAEDEGDAGQKSAYLWLREGKEKERFAPKADLNALGGSDVVFMIPNIHPEDVDTAVRDGFIKGEYTTASFDDTKKFKMLPLDYDPQSNRVVVKPSNEYILKAKEVFKEYAAFAHIETGGSDAVTGRTQPPLDERGRDLFDRVQQTLADQQEAVGGIKQMGAGLLKSARVYFESKGPLAASVYGENDGHQYEVFFLESFAEEILRQFGDAGLAVILAHELHHVAQFDVSKRLLLISEISKQEQPYSPEFLADIQRRFQQFEYDADRASLVVLEALGYDPEIAIQVAEWVEARPGESFRGFAQSSTKAEGKLENLGIVTHPSFKERIAKMRAYLSPDLSTAKPGIAVENSERADDGARARLDPVPGSSLSSLEVQEGEYALIPEGADASQVVMLTRGLLTCVGLVIYAPDIKQAAVAHVLEPFIQGEYAAEMVDKLYQRGARQFRIMHTGNAKLDKIKEVVGEKEEAIEWLAPQSLPEGRFAVNAGSGEVLESGIIDDIQVQNYAVRKLSKQQFVPLDVTPLSTARPGLAVARDAAQKSGKGGVDFRALPLNIASVDRRSVERLAQQSGMTDLNREWKAIEQAIRGDSVPYGRIKEYLAVCCQRGDAAGRQRVASWLRTMLAAEAECALASAPESKELLAMLASE